MFYMTFYDKHAFNSKCSAWDYGPVFGLIYYKYKSFGRSILTEDDEINDIENKDLKTEYEMEIKSYNLSAILMIALCNAIFIFFFLPFSY